MSKSSSIKEAVKRINAWRSGELDLSSLGLFEIPDELFKTKKLYASLESLRLNGNQLSSLPILLDPKSRLSREMKVLSLPITVILAPDGTEIARMKGDADWFSDSAQNIVEALLTE